MLRPKAGGPRREDGPTARIDGEGLLSRGLWGVGPAPTEPAGRGEGGAILTGIEADSSRPLASPEAQAVRGRASRSSALRQVISQKPFVGRYVRPVPARDGWQDLAWDAMLRAAALHGSAIPVVLRAEDLLRRQRLRRPGRLVLFVVDISGSMGGSLMDLARQLAQNALERAYIERDRVAMIAFRERSAELLFSATNQIEQVHRRVRHLPVGGTTPLGAGLRLAAQLLARAAARDRTERQRMVLISDGRANVGSRPGHGAVLAEVEAAARDLARRPELPILFLDTTAPGDHAEPARWLTAQLGARRVPVGRLDRRGAP